MGAFSLLKRKLPRRRLAALRQSFDVLPSCGKILIREFAQRRDDALPGAQFGACRLAHGAVFINLAIGACAVLAQKHGSMFRASDFPNKGGSITRPCAEFYSESRSGFRGRFFHPSHKTAELGATAPFRSSRLPCAAAAPSKTTAPASSFPTAASSSNRCNPRRAHFSRLNAAPRYR